MATMPGSEEQARLLEDALGVVRQQAMIMRRCLETPGKLMDALKCWCVLQIHPKTEDDDPRSVRLGEKTSSSLLLRLAQP